MSQLYSKWADGPNQFFTNHQPPTNQPVCAICAGHYLAGGSFVFLLGGGVLDLCAAEGRRLKSLSQIERAALIRELAARYAPDWRLAA